MTTCPPISMPSVTNLRDALELSSRNDLVEAIVTEMPLRPMMRLARDFISLAHAHQEPRAHALNGGAWTCWLMLGGRGAGKTRLGAE